jgi:hypothetical protein
VVEKRKQFVHPPKSYHITSPQFDIEYIEGMSDTEIDEYLDSLEDIYWQKVGALPPVTDSKKEKE